MSGSVCVDGGKSTAELTCDPGGITREIIDVPLLFMVKEKSEKPSPSHLS